MKARFFEDQISIRVRGKATSQVSPKVVYGEESHLGEDWIR
jgi:hypothetical protein